MLWDLIRDFFVMHVFGGMASNSHTYTPFVGVGALYDNGSLDDQFMVYNNELTFKVGHYTDSGSIQDVYMGIGDWLSTTATIISITIIVVLCALFVYKIVRLIGGLIR